MKKIVPLIFALILMFSSVEAVRAELLIESDNAACECATDIHRQSSDRIDIDEPDDPLVFNCPYCRQKHRQGFWRSLGSLLFGWECPYCHTYIRYPSFTGWSYQSVSGDQTSIGYYDYSNFRNAGSFNGQSAGQFLFP